MSVLKANCLCLSEDELAREVMVLFWLHHEHAVANKVARVVTTPWVSKCLFVLIEKVPGMALLKRTTHSFCVFFGVNIQTTTKWFLPAGARFLTNPYRCRFRPRASCARHVGCLETTCRPNTLSECQNFEVGDLESSAFAHGRTLDVTVIDFGFSTNTRNWHCVAIELHGERTNGRLRGLGPSLRLQGRRFGHWSESDVTAGRSKVDCGFTMDADAVIVLASLFLRKAPENASAGERRPMTQGDCGKTAPRRSSDGSEEAESAIAAPSATFVDGRTGAPRADHSQQAVWRHVLDTFVRDTLLDIDKGHMHVSSQPSSCYSNGNVAAAHAMFTHQAPGSCR